MSKEEKKYCTSEKELLAVVKGVQAYRPYLAGAKFTVYTDHRALLWIKSAKHIGRLERWALQLQEYNYDIIQNQVRASMLLMHSVGYLTQFSLRTLTVLLTTLQR